MANSPGKFAGCFIGLFLLAGDVLAHARFSGDLQLRHPGDDIKEPGAPCGGKAPAADAPRTVLKPGQKLELVWIETIDHPSKYRVGFSPDERDQFTTVLMDPDQFDNDEIRPGDLPDRQDKDGFVTRRTPREYRYTITVPGTPCERCSLQLIQRMYDKNPVSNYYSCADIKIVADPAAPAPPPAPSPAPSPAPDNPGPPEPAPPDTPPPGSSDSPAPVPGAGTAGKAPAAPTGIRLRWQEGAR